MPKKLLLILKTELVDNSKVFDPDKKLTLK